MLDASDGAQGAYQVADNDLASYLTGTWRQTVQRMSFGGGFDALAPFNSTEVISVDTDAAPEPNTRFLEWRRGQPLQTWMRLQFVPMVDGLTQLEWVWKNQVCGTSTFDPAIAAFTLVLDVPGEAATYTFRLIDAATMAVCVATAHGEPSIQFGHMIRVER